jgi:hypothetical protein
MEHVARLFSLSIKRYKGRSNDTKIEDGGLPEENSYSTYKGRQFNMCGVTIQIWHSGKPEKQRHLVHHRVDLCEYRKNSSSCDACRLGEVDPRRHEPDCQFRRHNGFVCDEISWWIIEKPQDHGCPVCQENERIRQEADGDVAEVNAKCDIYRYCQTLRKGPCPFLMVIPDDCKMGWSAKDGFRIRDGPGRK